MSVKRSALSFLAAALAATALSAAEPVPRLVGPDWLAANLANPKIRVIDMRGDIREYWENHVPGAVFLDADVVRWPDRGVPGKLMPPAELARLLGEMGIGRDTTVVIYSEINHYRAAYVAWALDYIRHPSWAILEDGFQGWKRQSLPLTQDYPKIRSVGYDWKGNADGTVRATMEDVRTRNRATTVLVDVRPAELFSGEKGTWKRKGHIEGAVSHVWVEDLNNNGTWKDVEVLRKVYADIGVTPDKTIIVSCGQGQMSAHTYFTLKYVLGFPRVRNYDGSFNEWSNVDALPIGSK
jgi:thiosulfate/3-mercaptopyruvate sulfurtransferase